MVGIAFLKAWPALALMALPSCSPENAGLCPWPESAFKYDVARNADQLRDNAQQCESYWLVRYLPVAASASEAAQATMTQCRLERESAYRALTKEGYKLSPLPEWLDDRRDYLVTVALGRKLAKCTREK